MAAAAHADVTDCVVPPRSCPRERNPLRDATRGLSAEQLQTLTAFRERLSDLAPLEQHWADDACLLRYLRARDYDLDKAEKLLRDTLEWRQSYGIESITPDMIDLEATSGKNYLHGTDKFGRPVIYQRPRRQNTKTYDDQVKQMAYLLERSVNSMDGSNGVEQQVLFIDFKDYSIFNAPPMKVTKQVLSLLMDKYPERLGAAFFVDAPMLFTTTYKVLKPFIPPATKAKVNFVKRSGTGGRHGRMDPQIAKYFDDDDLEEEYGGTRSSNYDHERYMALEREYYQEHLAMVQQERAALLAAGSTSDAPNHDAGSNAPLAPRTVGGLGLDLASLLSEPPLARTLV